MILLCTTCYMSGYKHTIGSKQRTIRRVSIQEINLFKRTSKVDNWIIASLINNCWQHHMRGTSY